MTVAELKPLEQATESADLFEALVASLEFIAAENESQRHLVSSSEWNQWTKAHTSFVETLVSIGESFTSTGVWRTADMDSLRNTFLRATHKSREELEAVAQASRAQAVEREQETSRVRGLLGRLRRSH